MSTVRYRAVEDVQIINKMKKLLVIFTNLLFLVALEGYASPQINEKNDGRQQSAELSYEDISRTTEKIEISTIDVATCIPMFDGFSKDKSQLDEMTRREIKIDADILRGILKIRSELESTQSNIPMALIYEINYKQGFDRSLKLLDGATDKEIADKVLNQYSRCKDFVEQEKRLRNSLH